MSIAKKLLQFLVTLFFKVYFALFGRPTVDKSMNKTLKLYQTGDFAEVFQMVRVWDAPFEHLQSHLPQNGVIVDMGCGDGLLANYIAVSRPKINVYGVDINKDRIKEAQKGLKNTKFIQGDITNSSIPTADAILLIHVLHHLLSKKDQEKLLVQCKNKLKKNGVLIVAEIAEQPFIKYLFTWLTDHVTVPILFEGKLFNPNVFFRQTKQWEGLFNKLGFSTETIYAHQGKPFSHILFICRP